MLTKAHSPGSATERKADETRRPAPKRPLQRNGKTDSGGALRRALVEAMNQPGSGIHPSVMSPEELDAWAFRIISAEKQEEMKTEEVGEGLELLDHDAPKTTPETCYDPDLIQIATDILRTTVQDLIHDQSLVPEHYGYSDADSIIESIARIGAERAYVLLSSQTREVVRRDAPEIVRNILVQIVRFGREIVRTIQQKQKLAVAPGVQEGLAADEVRVLQERFRWPLIVIPGLQRLSTGVVTPL